MNAGKPCHHFRRCIASLKYGQAHIVTSHGAGLCIVENAQVTMTLAGQYITRGILTKPACFPAFCMVLHM